MQYETQATLVYSLGTQPSNRCTNSIEVTVLFTDVPATLRALEKATELTANLNARVRLLVPQIVPYPLPLESPPVLVEFNERRFLAMACAQHVDIRVEICLCRDADALLQQRLGPRSLIVIGRRKRWWPTRETRLARRLHRRGHVVVFADVSTAPRKDEHV